MADTTIEKRVRWAGCLVVLGVAVQLGSFLWSHPLSFMAFIVIGCPLSLAGVLLYLYALASKTDASRPEARRARGI
jgi:predicted Kef-type K+ transport protein